RAFGKWQATSMAGFLVGPILGGILLLSGFAAAFLVARAFSILPVVPLLSIELPEGWRTRRARDAASTVRIRTSTQLRRMAPAIGAGAAPEYFSGAFLSAWAIFLTAAGGAAWEVGLSYTLFALPAMLF